MPFFQGRRILKVVILFNKHLQIECTKQGKYPTCKPAADFEQNIIINRSHCTVQMFFLLANPQAKSTLRRLSVTNISLQCNETTGET